MTAPHDFHALTIAAVRRETADAISLALAVPDGSRDVFRYRPGQHLAVRAMLGGEEVRRTYSISSGPGDRELWITIKRVEDGLFSSYAHASLAAGGTIEAMPPSGRFVAPDVAADGSTYLAVAAGSGITPVMGMIRHLLAREPPERTARRRPCEAAVARMRREVGHTRERRRARSARAGIATSASALPPGSGTWYT